MTKSIFYLKIPEALYTESAAEENEGRELGIEAENDERERERERERESE